jgi:hypothetical protein
MNRAGDDAVGARPHKWVGSPLRWGVPPPACGGERRS